MLTEEVRVQILPVLPEWIALFPVLESVTFTGERVGQMDANIQETISQKLAASMPTLKTVTFDSEVRQVQRGGVSLASAELADTIQS